MVASDSHSNSDPPSSDPPSVSRAAPTESARGLLRICPWPGDPDTAQLLLLDHRSLPRITEVTSLIERVRARGAQRIRTGVLFPPATELFGSLGFVTVDTLALLELNGLELTGLELNGIQHSLNLRSSGHHITAIGPFRWGQAVTVDQAAFGSTWGYDRRTLRSMRSATPLFRARCVRQHGRLAGYVMAGIGDRTGYIQRLAVHPDFQRQGIARELVLDAVMWMKDHSVSTVLVNTGLQNTAALQLYQELGFEISPEVLTVAELTLS
jgi:ribosomal protein S18 acetylase RimI-like enzyme